VKSCIADTGFSAHGSLHVEVSRVLKATDLVTTDSVLKLHDNLNRIYFIRITIEINNLMFI